MAVKIRLSRVGRKGTSLYRLIAIDVHKKNDGKAIEVLGSFDPHRETGTVVKTDRLNYWLSVGAKPSATVASLLSKLKTAAS